MALNVEPLSDVMGAAVTGLDVRAISNAADFQMVLDRLHRHDLLVFRDQRLEPADLIAFSRRFGALQTHVLNQFLLADHPEIYVISNVVEDGRPVGNIREGFAWHTDLSYMAAPTAYTILYGVEVPEVGGDTLFASMYAAYDALAPTERAAIQDWRTIRSYRTLHSGRPGVVPLTEAQQRRTPDVDHPVLRRHPATGRVGLYIGTDDVAGVVGMAKPVGLERIARLADHALQNRFRYRHRWRPRDLVVWDNRGTMHTATAYDGARYRRIVYRTSVEGEFPIGGAPIGGGDNAGSVLR